MENPYIIKSVARALELLKVIANERQELGLVETSRLSGLSTSSVFRLLATLQEYGYVKRNPENGKYGLGITCLRLGSVYTNRYDLRKQALPILVEFRDKFKETMHLAIEAGSEIVYVEKLMSLLPIAIVGTQVGGRAPAHCTALGKALLAQKSEAEIRQLYAEKTLFSRTANTITDIEHLLRELAQIRAFGYAMDNEETDLGVKCVAVPIFGPSQNVVGAISLSGPVDRIDRAISERQLIDSIKEAGRAISSLAPSMHLENRMADG